LQIPGLVEALEIPNGPVCSNFSPKYVERTFAAMKAFKEGNAIFTFPNTSIKCPGAPQKIMYMTEHYFRKTGKRDKANIMYNSSLAVIFGVKHYAGPLAEICKRKGINVNLRTNLVEVTGRNTAIFENLDTGERKPFDFEMLHVAPPMSTPTELSSCKELVNDLGYVDVNKDTMQHVRFNNVFSIGDCSGSPNSKTAASVGMSRRRKFSF
jgi:sulfide:quinone oxidoreductase